MTASQTLPATTLNIHHALEDRLKFELQPVLNGVALLANTIRVLGDFQAAAQVLPEFAAKLSEYCPTWCDPFAHGGEKSAESVLHELTRYAADLATQLIEDSVRAEGSDQ